MGNIVRALCVDRHPMLAEHLARLFAAMGLETAAAVGLENAVLAAQALRPQVIFCDYDVLAASAVEGWNANESIDRVPVIAVSLTRQPHEVRVIGVNGIAGFLYLPTATHESVMSLLASMQRVATAYSLPAPDRADPAAAPQR